ncbi:MAG TPA: hypothetical protein PK218_07740 [Flavobacterium sp.]|jgi:hypothetical protein|uniref:hypothetical protein n=1 Tax=Flavobacterium sp. TaxID=239 RepID=UPI002D09A58A|nr:hypothetical protein [Flavobacterium sp.]HPW98436.1 hypothetical protein [Flavobacterium sp.]HQA74712.1 hypothetical protein [Flavobacterium sp.]
MNAGFNKKESSIALKAELIFKLTQGLIEIVPKDNKLFLQETTVRFMLEDAMMIPAKISGAEAIDLYDIKMENATIIRKCAQQLYVNAGNLRFEESIKDSEYIELLRDEIEEFRLLFIDWVASFDQWNYIIDRWGLFNPPGVTAHDKDPDDSISFNSKEYFDGLDLDNLDEDENDDDK